jgi:2-polyprenyl-6-methoxyphenol hydroxylase-like FAD-dependent oxidoreductase
MSTASPPTAGDAAAVNASEIAPRPDTVKDGAVRALYIGIIGCGVGGCTAAIMLRRQGHAVTLFEQTPRVGPVGAGVLLQASGQRVLASLGLLDRVLARAERIEELIAHTHHGRLLSRLRFADRPGGHVAYGVHRGDLFGVLHDTLLAEGVELCLNRTICRVGRDGRTLLDHSGAAAGRFDLIVAADGSRSRLRQSSGAQAYVHEYGPAALWAVGRDPLVRGRLIQRARHTHQLCGLLPMGEERCSFFWGLNAADWPRLRESSFEAWRATVVSLMPQARPVLSGFTRFSDLRFASYRAVWMPRVVHGRVAFLGDAAHASSPLLGHGINLAMLDARDLAAAVAFSTDVAGALETYNARQRWRNAYYSGLSAALNPSFQGQSTLIGVARDIVLPRLQRVGPARRLMLRTLAGD